MRLYQDTLGELRLDFAASVDEALRFFDDSAPLHLARWGDGYSQSGFANPKFVQFHHTLIRRGFDQGQIDLIRVRAGERILGYFYNFRFDGVVYFYLSGLVNESESKLKPGLCGHALAIQHYADAGYAYYDFMGGEERYKSSLAECRDELFQLSLQKDRLHFRLENFLRLVKNRLGY
jgi:CelD/BcsL family acetyltransferase involved in cellulose biosynthesis